MSAKLHGDGEFFRGSESDGSGGRKGWIYSNGKREELFKFCRRKTSRRKPSACNLINVVCSHFSAPKSKTVLSERCVLSPPPSSNISAQLHYNHNHHYYYYYFELRINGDGDDDAISFANVERIIIFVNIILL